MSTRKDDERMAAELLSGASPRPREPRDEVAAITEAARATWREHYAGRRKSLSRWWLVPVAAALGATLITIELNQEPPAPGPVPVAKAELVSGLAFASGRPIAPGVQIGAGSLVRTSDSRVALLLTGGQSLRLDSESAARISSASLVQLYRGALYIDSRGSAPLTIRTPAGDFQPVGTQFEVRVNGATILRVREGRVRLQRPASSLSAAAGEEVRIGPDGAVTHSKLRPDDPRWEWATEAAPLPRIEGRSLRWFVEWVCREKGLRLVFADAETASLADTTTLHGDVERLTILDALRTAVLSAGLEFEVREGVLLIRAAR